MADARQLPQDYPPAQHVLRDLRIWSEAGEASPCAGLPVATRDLAVHLLAIGRKGPLRTQVQLLRRAARSALLRVEARDAGAGDRLCSFATALVGPFGA